MYIGQGMYASLISFVKSGFAPQVLNVECLNWHSGLKSHVPMIHNYNCIPFDYNHSTDHGIYPHNYNINLD